MIPDEIVFESFFYDTYVDEFDLQNHNSLLHSSNGKTSKVPFLSPQIRSLHAETSSRGNMLLRSNCGRPLKEKEPETLFSSSLDAAQSTSLNIRRYNLSSFSLSQSSFAP